MVQTTLEIIGLIFGLIGGMITVSNEFPTVRRIGTKTSKIAPWSQWDFALLDQGFDTLPDRPVYTEHDVFLPMFSYLIDSIQPAPTRPAYTEKQLKRIDKIDNSDTRRGFEDLMIAANYEMDVQIKRWLVSIAGYAGHVEGEKVSLRLSDDGSEIVFEIPGQEHIRQSFDRKYYVDRLNADIDRFFVHSGTLLIGMGFAFQALSFIV